MCIAVVWDQRLAVVCSAQLSFLDDDVVAPEEEVFWLTSC